MPASKEYGWLEAKQSGGAVYEQGVKESKRNKAIVVKTLGFLSTI